MSNVISLENGFVKKNDPKLERIVLGFAINKSVPLDELREVISEECFYTTKYARLWKGIEELADEGKGYDMMSVYLWLQSHRLDNQDDVDVPELVSITDESTTAGYFNASAIINQLHTYMLQRRLVDVGLKAVRYGTDADFGEIESRISELNEDVRSIIEGRSGGSETLQQVQREVLSDIIRTRRENKEKLGTRTGFPPLDESGGLHPSDFIVVAGETSMGKTAFANAIALNAADNGAKICYYTMEMSNKQLGARFLAMAENVSSSNILYNPIKLTDHDVDNIGNAILTHNFNNIFLFDRSRNNIRQILVGIRSMKARHNIDGAIIDYIGMIKGDAVRGQSEASMFNDIARDLKNLSKELNIWIIAISQLSRSDDSKNHVPSINKLKGSGGIAEAADDVYLVYRPEQRYPLERFPVPYETVTTNGKAMILVEKKRNGSLCRFICNFDGPRTLFTYDADAKKSKVVYNTNKKHERVNDTRYQENKEMPSQSPQHNEQDKNQTAAEEPEFPF